MRKADILFCPDWKQLPDQEVGRVVREVHDGCRDTDETATRLGWESATIEQFLGDVVPDEYPGEHLFALCEDDLRQYSIKQLQMMVKRAIVMILAEELTSIRAVARFLQKDSKYISWLLEEQANQEKEMDLSDPPQGSQTTT